MARPRNPARGDRGRLKLVNERRTEIPDGIALYATLGLPNGSPTSAMSSPQPKTRAFSTATYPLRAPSHALPPTVIATAHAPRGVLGSSSFRDDAPPGSRHSATANQSRLILHTTAFWLMHAGSVASHAWPARSARRSAYVRDNRYMMDQRERLRHGRS